MTCQDKESDGSYQHQDDNPGENHPRGRDGTVLFAKVRLGAEQDALKSPWLRLRFAGSVLFGFRHRPWVCLLESWDHAGSALP